MPIEDVDYMKVNSVRQSYMFLVDSADRDKYAYPTPSEYVVDFTTPFQNVVGFEVVNASIPRTMYNVDVINNGITFYIHDGAVAPTESMLDKAITTVIPPGEYTIQTLVVALNGILSMHVNNDSDQPFAMITAESTTNPPDVENKIRFRCPYPFFVDMGTSTCAETLGFDELTQPSENIIPITSRRYEAPFPLRRRVFHSVDIPPQIAYGRERAVFEGPRGVIKRLPVDSSAFVAQKFQLASRGYLKQIFAALHSSVASITDIATWEVRRDLNAKPDMRSSGLIIASTIAVSYTDGSLSDGQPVPTNEPILLEANVPYWLVLRSTFSNNLSVYYNDVIAEYTSMLTSEDGGVSWAPLDVDGVYFNMSVNVIVYDEYHVLSAPGIYSLMGPKYIVMRCREIEEHSFRSLAFTKHHLGIGMIKLGVVGYSENRMDFNKVPLREFHPIGKLTRLTLRFELPSGGLYDFKGVNHNVTFAIHYLEPVQKQQFRASILNPNYDGNFISYMYKQEDQESDSDDQEEDFDRDHLDDYRKQEALYLPENQWRRNLDVIQELPRFSDLDDD
jgi:hypothetical protein